MGLANGADIRCYDVNGEEYFQGDYEGAGEGWEGARAEYVEVGEGRVWLVLVKEKMMARRGSRAGEHGEKRRSYSWRRHCEELNAVNIRGVLSVLH